MKESKRYATAGAFRTALEARLAEIAAREQVELRHLRRQVSFDRRLARLFSREPAPWALKGGYAMELRLRTARATKDIDLTLRSGVILSGDLEEVNRAVWRMLQAAAVVALQDHFLYRVLEPIMDLDAAPYGGARYPVEAEMDARIFARFHLDVGIGDVVMDPTESVEGRDWLGFAGIPRPSFRLIPREQQFAEKLHAYTLPRSTPNSRVKDLIDLALLIRRGNLDASRIREAVRLTFERRRTHELPTEISMPPAEWKKQFARLTAECGLSEEMDEALAALRTFCHRVISE